jgi:hypothetical protein
MASAYSTLAESDTEHENIRLNHWIPPQLACLLYIYQPSDHTIWYPSIMKKAPSLTPHAVNCWYENKIQTTSLKRAFSLSRQAKTRCQNMLIYTYLATTLCLLMTLGSMIHLHTYILLAAQITAYQSREL